MDVALLHAVDLAIAEDWQQAKTILEELGDPLADRLFLLICALEEREHARLRHVSTIRHEIGNAISIAQANLEAMIDGVLEPSNARLGAIHAALSTTGGILDDLRRPPQEAISDVVRVSEFDICALIGAHVAAVAAMAQAKNVAIDYDPCGRHYEACVRYRGDATRVGQILRNVLLNAVRYTPPGGAIQIGCEKRDARLKIVVRDSGAGIAERDLPHVFELGFRGDTGKKGSGIGLAVVQKLARAMGGSASVESEEGEGAAFTLTLPAVAAEPQPPE